MPESLTNDAPIASLSSQMQNTVIIPKCAVTSPNIRQPL